ncbi:MAG: SGNH/GDSL hydrolase family protein [Isosphaeraceae bacterium]|nr:SGNH/GDSL hydrolase family protein [Isosphaeraceae bacterium]
MRNSLNWIVGLVGLSCPLAAPAADPPKFEFKDGDRVVLLGDTTIERDQKYGYLETLLTIANPDKNVTFRNLGWSGDTVRGTARAFFGTEADGFKHLKEHVLALKPTVLIVDYGMTDSFDGEAGLPRFVAGLNVLMGVLAETKARIVLLSPISHANLGRPLPDPAAHNESLRRYREAISKVAASRGALFVDLFHEWEKLNGAIASILTDDGIHLTEEGCWLFGVTLARQLGCLPEPWKARFHHNGRLGEVSGTSVTIDPAQPTGVHFRALDSTLPIPQKRRALDSLVINVVEPRTIVAEGLPDGAYRLKIDQAQVGLSWNFDSHSLDSLRVGAKPATGPSAPVWAKGVEVRTGPEYEQVERLRKVINEKNLLYFHRWRPQNETYLFGFRKHEQGNNAREIPLFDPLVEEKEKEIAKLRKPVPHTYELVRESEVAK